MGPALSTTSKLLSPRAVRYLVITPRSSTCGRPQRARTPGEQAGSQAGLVLLLTRASLALDRPTYVMASHGKSSKSNPSPNHNPSPDPSLDPSPNPNATPSSRSAIAASSVWTRTTMARGVRVGRRTPTLR